MKTLLLDASADLKERRLVGETAGWMARLGVRVAEGEFQARRGGQLERLLEQLAAENAKLASKKASPKS